MKVRWITRFGGSSKNIKKQVGRMNYYITDTYLHELHEGDGSDESV